MPATCSSVSGASGVVLLVEEDMIEICLVLDI